MKIKTICRISAVIGFLGFLLLQVEGRDGPGLLNFIGIALFAAGVIVARMTVAEEDQ